MKKKMAVLGSGAIGSSIGADLTKAGHDVMLIDQWPAHVDAMKANGLHILMKEGDMHVPVKAAHLCELATLKPNFDIVFLTAKSYDTRWMVELIKPYLKSDGVLVSIQNSMNDELIAPAVGYQRDIGSAIELAAHLFEPGRVRRITSQPHTWLSVGELHGRMTPRLQEIADILKCTGIIETSSNIWGVKWTKLIANCMVMGLSGMLGIYNWQVAEEDALFRWVMQTGRESLQVGQALGYRLEPLFGMTAEDMLAAPDDMLEKNVRTILMNITKESHSCIYHDHLRGRLCEVDQINGLVVEKGRAVNVPAPANQAICDITRDIEQGKLKISLDNKAVLEKYWKQVFPAA